MYKKNSITTTKPGLYEITDEIKAAVKSSGIAEGICVAFSKAPTAGVLISSFGDKLCREDIIDDLERIFPPRTNYAFKGDANMAAASSATALSGGPIDMIIHEGELSLGHSQGVFVFDTAGRQIIEYGIKCI